MQTWEGVRRKYCFCSGGGGGGGCLYLFSGRERQGRLGSAHTPGRGPVRERRRPPGFGSGAGGSRWLRIRSCGAPGTSGYCQARGLDPAGGRSIFPLPPPALSLARPVASLGLGVEPGAPSFFRRVPVRRV